MSEQIGYEQLQSTLVLHLPPEIDHHSSKEIRDRTEEYLRSAGICHIVFDFSRTTFMDSSGIGALLGRYKRMRERGGSVMIYGADARIRRILRISGVDKLIPHIETDVEA
ncbi:MAG: anti-sigma factor antagonist [Lachnospiraceae bacterium]|nr:anti-sigma factor antagonist [Lachnospiraceae bacterium]